MNSRMAQNGMSLIELIISMSILSVVLLAMIYGMLINNRLQHNSRLRDRAVADLESVRERLLSAPFEDVTTLYPNGSTIPALNNVPGEIITITYPSNDPSEDPMRIMITVQWRNNLNLTLNRTLEILKKK